VCNQICPGVKLEVVVKMQGCPDVKLELVGEVGE
jgi:hypothetical protein